MTDLSNKPRTVLGISAYYHDSAAALVRDGVIVAAAQEERFSRKKHDPRFPKNAVLYCLNEAGCGLADIDAVVFYDKPLLKFERLLETYLAFAPRGLSSFLAAMPVWMKEKLFLKHTMRKDLAELGACKPSQVPPLLFSQHHLSHAASAFYPSPYQSAAVLCLDGVGEWATTTAWVGDSNGLKPVWEIPFPHSLGLLYSAFTYYCGFKVNSGEYKLMGLAPYGEPKYTQLIYDHLIDVKPDGTFRLNMDYFNYATGLTMTNDRFAALFGLPVRQAESAELTQDYMDIAASIQKVTEEVVMKLAQSLHAETGQKNLCLAGGVALNCVANGVLLREGPFENIWIQPAAGDAGGALGAALEVWHQYYDGPRSVTTSNDPAVDDMQGAYLGPKYSNDEIQAYLDSIQAPYQVVSDDALFATVAQLLADEMVVGWLQGRMEFGPRALGGRSILGDPRSQAMQSVMNLKIKYRESFRPFAPSVLGERVQDFFDMDTASPYMLLVSDVHPDRQIPMTAAQKTLFGIEQLNVCRSDIPAVTHVDYSARVQTVHAHTNPRYHALIKAFDELTGCGVVVNTSFNVRGEPIVCTPQDAYRCFMRTEMDALVLENCVLLKKEQPVAEVNEDWKQEFTLD
jgi:carbamoyltransferase